MISIAWAIENEEHTFEWKGLISNILKTECIPTLKLYLDKNIASSWSGVIKYSK